jgi:hypothetical protein
MSRTLFLLILISFPSVAQFLLPVSDARITALGNSFLAANTGIFPSDNPASLQGNDKAGFNFTYKKNSRLPGMDQVSVSGITNVSGFNTGISVFRFGDENFSQLDLSAGLAHQIAHTALGLRMDLIQLRASGFNTIHAFSLSMGFISSISKKINIGASVQQLNNPSLGSKENKLLPVFALGCAIRSTENLQLGIVLRKDMIHTPRPSAGLEYLIKPGVFFRTGLQLNPYTWSAGMGFHYWKVTSDFAFTYTRFSGAAFQATARFVPGSNIKKNLKDK